MRLPFLHSAHSTAVQQLSVGHIYPDYLNDDEKIAPYLHVKLIYDRLQQATSEQVRNNSTIWEDQMNPQHETEAQRIGHSAKTLL